MKKIKSRYTFKAIAYPGIALFISATLLIIQLFTYGIDYRNLTEIIYCSVLIIIFSAALIFISGIKEVEINNEHISIRYPYRFKTFRFSVNAVSTIQRKKTDKMTNIDLKFRSVLILKIQLKNGKRIRLSSDYNTNIPEIETQFKEIGY
ncbi:hypothetical protein ACE1ET_06280 [Saccharicrinis sp. FJH62]|uniref:hypothetical protein n=1 Tax=Saccharicrinis sp. FJH62 TaxID=3344657 RepID=UPI0035D3DC39